jgi:hypothetical protein
MEYIKVLLNTKKLDLSILNKSSYWLQNNLLVIMSRLFLNIDILCEYKKKLIHTLSSNNIKDKLKTFYPKLNMTYLRFSHDLK